MARASAGTWRPATSLDLDVLGGDRQLRAGPRLLRCPPGAYDVRVPVDQYTMHDDAPTEVSYLLSEPVPLTIVP